MKILLSLLALISFNLFAAEPIIIDIGGVRHQCTPIGAGNPGQCFKVAYSGSFSREEAMTLCAGSYSDAPANCGILAYRGRYSRTESVNLCINSTTNTGPVDCANLAYNGPFSALESLTLCSNNGSERTAVCAIDAYRSGPYSKDEAIRMCKNPRFPGDKALISEKNYSKAELNKMIEEANSQAIERKEYK